MYLNQSQRKPNERFWAMLWTVLIVMYVAHYYLPTVGFYMPSIVYLGCFAIIACALALSSGEIFSSSKFLILIGAFLLNILSVIFMLFSNDIVSTAVSVYGYLQTFLYGWIALWYIKYGDAKETKRLFKIVLWCYIITSVTTIVGNIRYPGASRFLATSTIEGAEYSLYVSQNIGSFTFVYGLVLVMPLLMYMAKRKKINPIISTIMFIIIGFAILNSEYTTALLIFVMNLILLFFRKLTTKKIIIFIIICLVVILIGTALIASLFDFLADSIESENISSRFEYIAATLRGESVEEMDKSSDRMTLYKKAIDEIIESNFLGNWGETAGSGHSMILDTVVKYGIFGIVVLAVMYRCIYKYAVYPHKNKSYGPYIMWIYLIAILLAVLNPKANLMIFIFVIPLFAKTIDDSEQACQIGGTCCEKSVDSK